jgi:MarR family transcriptional regulator, organic hydroperoxide resistance regulator
MKAQNRSHEEFRGLIGRLVRGLNLLDWSTKSCCGITTSQCYTIETLSRGGALAMRELSEQMGVSVSTMTRVVEILVRNGVVRRKTLPGDRRRVYVELTPVGRDISVRLNRCADEYSKQILKRLPAGCRKDVLRSLGLLADTVDRVKAEDCKCST